MNDAAPKTTSGNSSSALPSSVKQTSASSVEKFGHHKCGAAAHVAETLANVQVDLDEARPLENLARPWRRDSAPAAAMRTGFPDHREHARHCSPSNART